MRENIGLYRGKRCDNGEWIEGCYIHLNANADFICQGRSFNSLIPINIEIIPETVGEYTGRNVGSDKLYEGDIVEWIKKYDDNWGDSKTFVGHSLVIWDSDNDCWALKTDTYIQPFNDFIWDNCYVIGSIHDNPELLK